MEPDPEALAKTLREAAEKLQEAEERQETQQLSLWLEASEVLSALVARAQHERERSSTSSAGLRRSR